MIEIAVRKTGGRLVPVDQIAIDRLATVPATRDLMVKVSAPQNMKLLRFLWALADKVADACEWLHDGDDAMDELKIRARHVKYLANPTSGEVRIVPKSLTKLDGPGLSRLANRMVYVVCHDIVPGLDETALRNEILAMCAGDERQSSNASASADAGAAPGLDSAAPLNSSREPQPPSIEPETMPAPELSPAVSGAGATSSPTATSGMALVDEPKQAGGGGNSPVSNVTGLPADWAMQYAAALRRATKPIQLPKRAAEYWDAVGGWNAHKDGPNAEDAASIYNAFKDHFADPDKRDAILFELGAGA